MCGALRLLSDGPTDLFCRSLATQFHLLLMVLMAMFDVPVGRHHEQV
jgi:hypothetical protein